MEELTETNNWVAGWLEYSLYGIVVVAIVVFVLIKVKRGKKRRLRNKNLRNDTNKSS